MEVLTTIGGILVIILLIMLWNWVNNLNAHSRRNISTQASRKRAAARKHVSRSEPSITITFKSE